MLSAENIVNNLQLKNEVSTNKFIAKFLLIFSCLLILILSLVIFYNFEYQYIVNTSLALLTTIIPLPIISIISYKNNHYTIWLKHLFLISIVFLSAVFDLFYSFYASILMVLPTLLASKYYNKKLNWGITFFTIFFYFISTFLAYYLIKNNISFQKHYSFYFGYKSVPLLSEFIINYITKCIFYILIVIVATNYSKNGKQFLNKQIESTINETSLHLQLSMGAEVQKRNLPNIQNIKNQNIDIFAILKPSKEVSGDFYDFFMVDNDTIAFSIADVSDKGLPASMMMMMVKNIIKSLCRNGLDIVSTFNYVNKSIYNNSDAMFVTIFMAFINIKSGNGHFINAGHPYPFIKKYNNKIQILKSDPQPFLGAVPDFEYTASNIKLDFEDTILLFTDGATDALNSDNQRFETNNIQLFLNQNHNNSKNLCENLLNKILEFSNNQNQFDDITLLAFSLKKSENLLKLPAINSSIQKSINWIKSFLDEFSKNQETNNLIYSAVDDILSNIVDYAYPNKNGDFQIKLEINDKKLSLIFIDCGQKFNPLNTENPNLEDTERIGGLGIFIIKNIFDNLDYQYINNQNIFTVSKNF
ncbi:MAG: SpoIIE family protein phosphatase [Bacteroidales bacterium]|nr:SpoIIE family protein phosphatase [Bacteroidales bacterium]